LIQDFFFCISSFEKGLEFHGLKNEASVMKYEISKFKRLLFFIVSIIHFVSSNFFAAVPNAAMYHGSHPMPIAPQIYLDPVGGGGGSVTSVARGGTGVSLVPLGNLLSGNGTFPLNLIAPGSNGTVLTVVAGLPQWSASIGGFPGYIAGNGFGYAGSGATLPTHPDHTLLISTTAPMSIGATATENTALGYNALQGIISGNSNTAVGSGAGSTVNTGNNNIYIGYNAQALSPAESNNIVIGNAASATAYIRGINASPVTGGSVVVNNSSGKTGTVASSSTSGIPLVSTGSSTTPAFGTAVVAGGGTGVSSLTTNALLAGGISSTGSVQQVAQAAIGLALISNNTALPSFGVLTVSGGGTGASTFTAHGVLLGEAASPFGVTGTGTAGQALISSGASADPSYATLPVFGGGTGLTTLTPYNLLVGAGANSPTMLPPSSSSGLPLVSQGSSANPTYGSISVAGGGTGLTSFPAINELITSGTTTTNPVQVITNSSNAYPLVSTGTATQPAFSMLTVPGGGTGKTSLPQYSVLLGNGSGAVANTSVGAVGTVLVGTSANPTFSSTPSVTSISIANTPSLSIDGTNKQYVDLIASGFVIKAACLAATVADLGSVVYANTGSPAGATATLTNAGTQLPFTIDGVSSTLLAGQRVLIKNQASTLQNGIYTVTTVGTVSTNWVLTRATDFNAVTGTLPYASNAIVPGALVPVTSGSSNVGTTWLQTDTITAVGTSPIEFVKFLGTISTSLQGNSGSASGTTVIVAGGANINTVGSGINLTVAVSGTTDHAVQVGNSSGSLTSIATGSSGQALVSGGGSADPAFGTLPVVGGGTGAVTLTARGMLFGNGTGAVQASSVGTAGQALVSGGGSIDPQFATLTVSGGGTSVATLTPNALITGGLTNLGAVQQVATGTIGQVLISQGSSSIPQFGTLSVSGGGTGTTTFTAHGVILGEGTSALGVTSAGTAGQVLISGGASADPSFGTLTVSGGGTGLTNITAYNLMLGNNASAPTLLPPSSTVGLPLISQGSSLNPTYGAVIVSGGGTGVTAFEAINELIASGTTTTGAVQLVANSSILYPLISTGLSTLPSFSLLTVPGGGTGAVSFTANGVLVGQGAASITSTGSGTEGQVLISGGASANPNFGVLSVSGGGTGLTIFTTANQIVASGTGPTESLQSITNNANPYPLLSTGLSTLPEFGLLTVPGGGTGLATLPVHNLIVGEGASTPNFIAPSTTVGIPLVSAGSSSDPNYGVAVVAGGGTGKTTLNINALLASGNTATESLQQITNSAAGLALISTGPSTLPAFGTVSVSGGGTGISALNTYEIVAGGTSTTGIVQQIANVTEGQALISRGVGVLPSYATLTVSGGGTGLTSLSARGVLVGNGTSNVIVTSEGTAGQALVSGGSSTNPSFATLPVIGGGTGRSSLTAYNVMVGANGANVTLVPPVDPAGIPLISKGASLNPAYGTAVVAGGGTGMTSFAGPNAVIVSGSSVGTDPLQIVANSVAPYPLVSTGTSTKPQFSLLSVSGGGTGAVSFTQYGVMLGNGSGALGVTSPGTAGQALIAGGTSNPSFGTLSVSGGGTGISTFGTSTNQLITSGSTATGNMQTIANSSSAYPLVSTGTSTSPTFAMLTVPGGGTGLTSLTQYAVVVGNGTTTPSLISPPSATAGIPLVSAVGTNPIFATATVAGGGTGKTTLTANALIAGGSSSTGVMQQVVQAATGLALISNNTALPLFGVLGLSGGGTGATTLTQYGVLTGNGTGSVSATTAGFAGQVLISSGGVSSPTFGSLSVSGGGTGITNFTVYNLLVGAGASTPTLLPPSSTSGIPLVSTGATSNPSYSTAVVAGGGTGVTTFSVANELVASGTTPTNPLQVIANNANFYPLVSTGLSTLPAFSALTVSGGGTGKTTLTASSVLLGNGTGAVATTNVGAAGTVLVGTGSNPTFSATPTVTSVTIANAPVLPTDGANKAYVDTFVSGFSFKSPCVASTTEALTSVSYNNGTSGINAMLSHLINGTFSIDGVYPTLSQRVLIKDQTAMFQNGIYTVITEGSASTIWGLRRATDFDTTTECAAGSLVSVTGGSTNLNTIWLQTDTVTEMGTSNIEFSTFLGQGTTNLQGNTGAASGSTVVVQGGNNIYTSGSGISLTVNVSGTTEHAVQIGNSSGSLTSLGLGTTGQALLSGGSNSDPAFGNLSVSAGGTGTTVFTTRGILFGNSFSAISATPTGTQGQPLISGGANFDPAYNTLTVSGGGTGLATFTTENQIVTSGTTPTNQLQTINNSSLAYPLVSNGLVLKPSFTNLTVGGGGTGVTSLTANNLLIGAGTSAVQFIAQPTTSGIPLVSSSSGSPTYSTAVVAGGGTGLSAFVAANQIVATGTSTTGQLQEITNGTQYLPLVSTGTNSLPQFGALLVSGGGTGQTSLTARGILVGNGTGSVVVTTQGTQGQALISGGALSNPSFGTLTVSGGGTGLATFGAATNQILTSGTLATSNVQTISNGTSGYALVSRGSALQPNFAILTVPGGGTGTGDLTSRGILFGGGTSPISATAVGTQGQPLLSGGGNSDPQFGVLTVSGGGTSLSNFTAYNVMVGNGIGTPALIAPSTTAGVPLVSTGNASNPVYTTASVPGGGTGVTTFIGANQVITSGITAAGSLQGVTASTQTYPLVSTGVGSAPVFNLLTVAGGGTGATTLTPRGVVIGNGTAQVAVTAEGSLGQALVSGGSSSNPSFATLSVSGGGTGLTSIPVYNLIIGNNASTPTFLAPISTVGIPLTSQGTNANPAYGTASVSGGGTGLTSVTKYAVLCGGSNPTASLNSVAPSSTQGQGLVSAGSNVLPVWQNVLPGYSVGTDFMYAGSTTTLQAAPFGTTIISTTPPENITADSADNTALGFYALNNLMSGYENTAVGFSSLFGNTQGLGNAAFGNLSLANAIGNQNTAIGSYAGINLLGGDNNIYIGYNAQPADISNSESNNIVIGNNNSATCYIHGINNATEAKGWVLTINSASKIGRVLAPASSGLPLISQGSLDSPIFGSVSVSGGGTGLATIPLHNLIVGAGTNAPNLLAPSAAIGLPLISQGSLSDPTYGTASVSGGGTGLTILSVNALMAAGNNVTASMQQITNGTAGQVLMSTGTLTLPAFGNLSVTSGGTGVTGLNPYQILTGGITTEGIVQQIPSGTAGQALVAQASGLPQFGTLSVSGGGTGSITFNSKGILFGNTTSAVSSTTAGTEGHALISGGSSGSPAFGIVPVIGGGTGATLLTPYNILVGADTTTALIAPVTTVGIPLVSQGLNTNPAYSTTVVAGGGTGVTTFSSLNSLIMSGTVANNPLRTITSSNEQYPLVSNGPDNPPTFNLLTVGGGGTGVTSLTQNSVLLGNGTSNVATTGVGSAGTVLIGTGGAPSFSATPNVTSINIATTIPVNPNDGATKAYADLLAAGFTFKQACVTATTANLTSLYTAPNGPLTGPAEILTIDGVMPTLNQRVLVKNQTNQAENGIYQLSTVGTGSIPWVLTRTTDFDSITEIIPGVLVPVTGGATYTNTIWLQYDIVTVIGTSAIAFSQFLGQGLTVLNADSGYASGTTVTVVGGANIYTTGSGATLTIDLSETTNHAVQVGNSTGSLTSLGLGTIGQALVSGGTNNNPSFSTLSVFGGGTGATTLTSRGILFGNAASAVAATGVGSAGQPLLSNAGASDPAFGNLAVVGGGTGVTTFNGINQVLTSGLTAAGALRGITASSAAYPFISTGASSAPTFALLSVPGGGTGVTSLTVRGVLIGNDVSAITATSEGTAGQALISSGSAANPSFATLGVFGGGTGRTTLPAYNLLVGNNASAPTLLAPSTTSGLPLVSQGDSANPTYGTAVVSGGGTGLTYVPTCAVVCGGTGITASLQSVTPSSTEGQGLVSAGANTLPVWQNVLPGYNVGTNFMYAGSTATLNAAPIQTIIISPTPPENITANASGNTAVGAAALQNIHSGTSNTAIGTGALNSNLDGSNNTIVGANACPYIIGSNNTALGCNAGSAITNGSNNIYIGYNAAPTSDSESDHIVIGNSQSASTHLYGIYGVTEDGGSLVISNSVHRLATIIAPVEVGLPLISQGVGVTPIFGSILVPGGGTGLSSIPLHNLIVGAGTGTPNLLAPSSTAGLPLVSQGLLYDPTYGTANVAGGGTGLTTLVVNQLMAAGTGATENMQQVTAGTTGQALISQGGSLPQFGTLSVTGGGTGITTFANKYQIITSGATAASSLLSIANTENLYPLISTGTNSAPEFGLLSVAGGGTGAATLTQKGVLIGNSTSPILATSVGSAGQALVSNGGVSNPEFGVVGVSGGGTGLATLPANNLLVGNGTSTPIFLAPTETGGIPLVSVSSVSSPTFGTASVSGGGTGVTQMAAFKIVCGGTTNNSPLQTVASFGNSGQGLISSGDSNLPTWGNIFPGYATGSGFAYAGSSATLQAFPDQTMIISTSVPLNIGESATDNTALGYGALNNIETGFENTAIGSLALLNNTFGGENTAVGALALYSNTVGFGNTGIGYYALLALTESDSHIPGESDRNTALGEFAGSTLLYGANNLYLGAGAQPISTTESNNIVIGNNQSATCFIRGINAAAINNGSLVVSNNFGQLGTLDSSASTGIALISQGTNSPTFGTLAVSGGGTGLTSLNPFAVLCGGINSEAALQSVTPSATQGQALISTGNSSLPTWGNVFPGYSDLDKLFAYAGTTATLNASPFETMIISTTPPLSINNNAIGNTALGAEALRYLAGGIGNTAVGVTALLNTSGGSYNSVFGSGSLTSNISGSGNTAMGNGCLSGQTAGDNNIAIGHKAGDGLPGQGNAYGDNNIYIGYNASRISNSESNRIVIGNDQSATTHLFGVNHVTESGGSVVVSNTEHQLASIPAPSTSGVPLISQGVDITPTFGAASIAGGGTGLTSFPVHNLLVGSGSTTATLLAPPTTSGIPLVSGVSGYDPTFGMAVVAGGGTGRTTLTSGALLVGNVANAVTEVAVGATGSVLVGQSGGAPIFSTTPSVTSMNLSQLVPTSNNQAATKYYVDAQAGGNFSIKSSCVAATALIQLTATYLNGTLGVNATLTNAGPKAAFSIDGVPSAELNGQRVLIKDQMGSTEAPWNGIYTVTTLGDAFTNWVLTRTSDFDTAAEMIPGVLVPVTSGDTNAHTIWLQTQTVTTVGNANSPVEFVVFLGEGTTSLEADNLVTITNPTIIIAGGRNIVTSASETTATLTIDFNNATQYALQVGAADGGLDSLGVGSDGQALISHGSANPGFGVLSVVGGGTGVATLPQYGVLVGQAALNVAGVTAAAAGQVLLSSAGNPSFVTPTYGTGLTLTRDASTLSYGIDVPVLVSSGGTGLTSLTQYGLMVGNDQSTPQFIIPPVTAGIPLVSVSSTSNPTYSTASVAGGGTGLTTQTANAVVCGATSASTSMQFVSGLGNAGQGLVSSGSGLPSWQNVLPGYVSGNFIHAGTTTTLTNSPAGTTIISTTPPTSMGATAYYNTAVGINALNSLTSGQKNTAIGEEASYNNTSGTENVAIGYQALNSNITGYSNVAIGTNTLSNYSTSINNVAIGYHAGRSVFSTTGSNNIYLGANVSPKSSGESNTTVIGNSSALKTYITGINGIALAGGSLVVNTSAHQLGTIAIPATTGIALTSQGSLTTPAFGTVAVSGGGTGLTTLPPYNLFVGGSDGNSIAFLAPPSTAGIALVSVANNANPTFGSISIAGGGTGLTTTLPYSVLCGGTNTTAKLQSVATVGTAGQGLVSNGALALPSWQNLFPGYQSGTFAYAGSTYTTTISPSATMIISTNAPSASITSGAMNNTALGHNALKFVSSGNDNTAIGASALISIASGDYNTAIGSSALIGNSLGLNNTAVGYASLFNHETGSNNTALGYNAANNLTYGSNNIYIGYNVLAHAASESNNTVIGNGSTTKAYMFGITGATETGGSLVLCNSSSQLAVLESPSTAGIPLVSVGAGTNPTYSTVSVAGGGTGMTQTTPYAVICGGSTITGGLQSLSSIGTAGQALMSSGSGLPSWQNVFPGYTTSNFLYAGSTASLASNPIGTTIISTTPPTSTILAAAKNNSVLGYQALDALTSGTENTVVGAAALSNLTNGISNTAIGSSALAVAINNNNTAIGQQSLSSLVSGSDNTALGFKSGFGLTGGSNNIYIGNSSVPHVANESNNTVIGNSSTTVAYMFGTGVTLSDGSLMVRNSSSQLGRVLSPATVGLPLLSAGTNISPTYGVLSVAGGGTGAISLTAGGLLVGGGTGAVTTMGSGATNTVLVGTGSSPVFSGTPTVSNLTITAMDSNGTSATTKTYVDAKAGGGQFFAACTCATTTELGSGTPIIYDNSAGTIQAGLGDFNYLVVDGVIVTLDMRVLVKDQNTPCQNGAYYMTQDTTGGHRWKLTRAPDYDDTPAINPGDIFPVTNGTVNANTMWMQVNDTAGGTCGSSGPVSNPNNNIVFMNYLGANSMAFTTDAGSSVTGSTITIVGGNNLYTSGSGSTLNINLSETTNHAVQVGSSTGALSSLGFSVSGKPLVCHGSGSDPAFETLTVSGGGTGQATFTQYGVLVGNITAGINTVTQSVTAGLPLVSASGANPTFGTALVAGGGTGLATLTSYGLMAAGAAPTANMQQVAAGTAGQALIATATLPAFGTLSVSGGGTGLATTTANAVVCGATSTSTPMQFVSGLGTAGQGLMSSGSGVPSWQNVFPGYISSTFAYAGTTSPLLATPARTMIVSTSVPGAIQSGASDNTALGANSLNSITSGTENVAVGSYALQATTSGGDNVAVGHKALYSNSSGTYNVALGHSALFNTTTGTRNSAVGYTALNSNTLGSNNTAIGYAAGSNLTGGSNNLYLGYNAQPIAGSESNNIVIGNSLSTTVYINGINGASLSGGSLVVSNNTEQLGTIAASVTTGIPLVSAGSGVNPTFSTAVVAGGGTGLATLTTYALLTGGSGATMPMQQITNGTAGQTLIAVTGAQPTWANLMQTISVPLSAAEINALRATPKTLIPAPGPGKIINVISCMIRLNYVALFTANANQMLAIGYTNITGPSIIATAASNDLIKSSADRVLGTINGGQDLTSYNSVANQPVVIYNTSTTEISGGAGSSMTVFLTYQIINI
jgi:hypothetical protein